MTTFNLQIDLVKLLKLTEDLETYLTDEEEDIEAEYVYRYKRLAQTRSEIADRYEKIAQLQEEIFISKIITLCRTGK